MKRVLFLCFLCIVFNTAFAQKWNIAKITDSLQNEGKALYLSEMASWHGTDIFLEKCKSKLPKIGGYLSYDAGVGMTNIFFSKDDLPIVLATITFDYKVDKNKCNIDTINRALTSQENDLYIIRQKALGEINRDTIFKKYNHTDLNLIPLIRNGFKRVYVLTGPKGNGVVIIGNDYLIEFNNKNDVSLKRKLHAGILPFIKDPKQAAESTIHTHLPATGEFITATDICTLMLYEKFAGWKSHIVMSKNYVSSWNCQTDQLVILTREAWANISKSEK